MVDSPAEFVNGLELSTRANKLLVRHGIDSKTKLHGLTLKELLEWENCGRATANEIMDKLFYLKDRQVNRRKRYRLGLVDNLILSGKVMSRGSLFAGPMYLRRNALRLTWEFKEASTDEIIRLAYQYGKYGNSWVRMVMEETCDELP